MPSWVTRARLFGKLGLPLAGRHTVTARSSRHMSCHMPCAANRRWVSFVKQAVEPVQQATKNFSEPIIFSSKWTFWGRHGAQVLQSLLMSCGTLGVGRVVSLIFGSSLHIW